MGTDCDARLTNVFLYSYHTGLFRGRTEAIPVLRCHFPYSYEADTDFMQELLKKNEKNQSGLFVSHSAI
jgi:hypothetical protein